MVKVLAALIMVATSATTLFGSTLYVTPTGAGNQDGSDWANAFAGIQAAVDAADAAYAADGTLHDILVGDGTYTRVVVSRDFALQVRSQNGAASTIIDGYGTNGCVYVYTGSNFSQAPTFTGFTLRNGDDADLNDYPYYNGGGAGGGTLVDCVIEDCRGWNGGGTFYSDTVRCIVRNCTADNRSGGVDYGTHRNTLIYGNTAYNRIVYYATLYNCTVVDNAVRSGGIRYSGSVYNCIFWGNTVGGEASAQDDAEDPRLVGDGDYRARVGSPVIDGGNAGYAAEAGATDLAGNARVQGSAIDRGCYEGPGVSGFVVKAVADGNGSVSPTSLFTNANAVVTIEANTSAYNRQVVEWTTNGVTAAWSGSSLTLAPLASDVVVTARFEVIEWYVDAATGSDSNPGYDSSAPFKTIQKAVDTAAPSEVIYVMPGVYAPIDTTQRHVDIVGVEGAERTIIDGGGTTRCANLQSSRLTGFTLRNGRAISTNDQDGGGGVKWGTLVDCVISNNVANYGGGAYDSYLFSCVITDNTAGDGGGFFDGKASDCLVIYNAANQGGGARGGPNSSFYHCTFAYNRALIYGAVMEAFVYNSVFYKNSTANHRSNYRLFDYDCCTFDDRNGGVDPLFVDPENGDFRLRAGSPCVDSASSNYVVTECDIRGEGYDRIVGNAPDRGCYEGAVEGHVISVRTDGHGGVSDKTIVVADGEDATVTAIEDGRTFQHWLVDGEQVRSGATLELDAVTADHVVTACFERRTTNVSGGNGALQTAINAAKDGDTLLVAAGTYSAIDATGRVLDIVSASGPATTIIQGKNSLLSKKRAVTFGQTTTRPRCTLTGFTVEGGYCNDYTTGGGGVFGGIVSNCVVRNNGALLGGGGAAYCDLVRCVISNNSSTVIGAGALTATLKDCLVVGNTVTFNGVSMLETLGLISISDNFGGGAGIAYAAAEHCTITGNTAKNASGGGAFWAVLNDTYIAGNTSTKSGGFQNFYKCPVTAWPWFVCSEEPDYATSLGYVAAAGDDTFVNAAAGNYRLKATSACVDAGDEDYLERLAETDLDGAARWRGKAPDIGCYEIDAVEPTPVSEVSATRSDAREDVEVSWTRTRGSEWYEVLRSETERWADAERIGVATNIASSFVDDTAAYATRYWYWVVSHSDVGDAERDGSASGYWTTPLAITTASLPSGTSPYSKPLAATGGIGPYEWSVYDAKYQFTTNDVCTFDEDGDGTQLGYDYFDGLPTRNSWTTKAVPLPFKFPYFGVDYTNVWLHSGGLLVFGDAMPYEVGNGERNIYSTNNFTAAEFLSMPAIAPYLHANYGGIYMAVGESSVTFRWAGSCYYFSGGNGYAWFSLTLYPNGEFDFKYGDDYGTPYDTNNEPYARYGWSSGTGEGFLALVGGSLAGAPDRCIRYAPAPAWLAARTDQSAAPAPGVAAGVISATPPATTNSEIVVAVKDDDGRASYRRFRLIVNSSGSLTGYAAWAALNGLGGPDEVTDGQPNLIRYAFNVPRGAFSPFTGISFNASGKPVVTLLPLVNTDGVTVKVLSTTDLTDWSNPEVRTLTISDNGTLIFDHATDPQRFYRLKAE